MLKLQVKLLLLYGTLVELGDWAGLTTGDDIDNAVVTDTTASVDRIALRDARYDKWHYHCVAVFKDAGDVFLETTYD